MSLVVPLLTTLLAPLADAAPKIRSAARMQEDKGDAMRQRRVDPRGPYVLVHAYGLDKAWTTATADKLLALLKGDPVDASTLVNANKQLLAVDATSESESGAGALIARLEGTSLKVSYVGALGVIRVRKSIAERVALPHTIIEDFIRMRDVPEEQRETLRLEAPQRFVTVRNLGRKPEVEVESLTIPVQKGDRLVLAGLDVLASTPLSRFASAVASAHQPDDAAQALLSPGSPSRISPAPAVIVLFVE